MNEFIGYVLWELKNSLGLVLLVAAAAVAVFLTARHIHRKKYGGQRKFPWGRALLYLIALCYFAVVLYATMLRGSGHYREYNLHLFRAWREAWNQYSVKNWANVLLNVAMFLPMGFLLPLLGRKLRKWYLTIPIGFGVSLAIELIQLAIGRGICDVDDLFANTLGTVMGYFVIMILLSFVEKRRKQGLKYGCLALASILPICSIFVAYEWKEYGNLPDAAAYTNNTRQTQWSLDCQLPETGGKVSIYRNSSRSKADCDAFAELFRQIIHTEYDGIYYYEEAAYYMDQSMNENGCHFLYVSYMDTGYEYSAHYEGETQWTEGDRATLEDALAIFPVLLPDYAEFTVEGDGWHSFTVERYVDGTVMVDGTLRCRYAGDGTVRNIENHLLSYTFYEEVEIISAQEAYELLCAGKFYDEGYFEWMAPASVSVCGCSLEYAIDTKGFYQPVYCFDVVSADGVYQDRILIPAMQ